MIIRMKQSIKMYTGIYSFFSTMPLTLKGESRSVLTSHTAKI